MIKIWEIKHFQSVPGKCREQWFQNQSIRKTPKIQKHCDFSQYRIGSARMQSQHVVIARNVPGTWFGSMFREQSRKRIGKCTMTKLECISLCSPPIFPFCYRLQPYCWMRWVGVRLFFVVTDLWILQKDQEGHHLLPSFVTCSYMDSFQCAWRYENSFWEHPWNHLLWKLCFLHLSVRGPHHNLLEDPWKTLDESNDWTGIRVNDRFNWWLISNDEIDCVLRVLCREIWGSNSFDASLKWKINKNMFSMFSCICIRAATGWL